MTKSTLDGDKKVYKSGHWRTKINDDPKRPHEFYTERSQSRSPAPPQCLQSYHMYVILEVVVLQRSLITYVISLNIIIRPISPKVGKVGGVLGESVGIWFLKMSFASGTQRAGDSFHYLNFKGTPVAGAHLHKVQTLEVPA